MIKNRQFLQKKSYFKALCWTFLLLVMLNTSLVSAWDFDNYVAYEKEDRVVVLENAFGLGDLLGKAELTSHSSPTIARNVFAGKDRVVMFYEFYDWKEIYKNGLGEVIFTDMNTNKEIQKDYKFVYATYKDVEEPINVRTCAKEMHNSTLMNICNNEITGYETVRKFDKWVELTGNDIPKDNITIGIMTDVALNDNVDGVWTIAGKKVTKHAVWTAGLNVDLQHYYTFDNDTRNGDSIPDLRGGDTGIEEANGTGFGINYPAGILGGQSIDNANGIHNMTMDDESLWDDILNYTYPITISLWININTGQEGNIFGKGINGPPNGFFVLRHTNSNGLTAYWEDDNGGRFQVSQGGETAGDGSFIHFVMVYYGISCKNNINCIDLFVNADNDTSKSLVLFNLAAGLSNDVPVNIGNAPIDANALGGSFDEFAIWNRTLSQAEITDLYNGGTGIQYEDIAVDTTPPNITINSPTNDTFGSIEILFNVTPEDETEIDSCWYSINNGIDNVTMSNATGEVTNWKHTNSTMTETEHISFFYCNDTIGNINTESSNVSFNIFIDVTPPEVTITNPQNISYSTNQTIINYTFVEENPNRCWYSLNGGVTNSSSVECGTNFTDVPSVEGANVVIMFINDTASNQNSSANVSYYQDSIFPDINITTPTNHTNSTDNTIDVNFTYFETNIDSCWWTENRGLSNTTLANCDINITNEIWSNGDNTIIVYINDTLNNINNSAVFFTIDTEIENISLTPLGDVGYQVTSTNLTINWTAEDPHIDTCLIEYAGVNNTVTCSNNGTTINTTSSSDRNVILFVNDTFGNTNSTNMSWEYKVFENSQTFNDITIEGATETFILNFTSTTLLQVSQVNITYNGTITSSPYVVTGNEVIAQTDLTIPNIESSTNLSFYWNVTFSDDSVSSSPFTNQSVLLMKLDNCSENSNLMYNFTMLNEELKTNISDSVMEISVNLWDIGKNTIIINFSKKYTNINPAQVCINQSLLTNTNYSSYTIVKYTANDTLNNISYTTEYHNRFNETISNSSLPINVNLYTLDSDDSTAFRLTFRDSSYVLAPNILVNLYRQYVEDNDFKLVEAPLTDSDGQTILNLVRNTIIYNIVMTDEAGNIVATFNRITAFCQDFTIGECTINLNAETIGGTTYSYNSEFDISIIPPTYSNTTNLISLDFVTGDLLPKTVRMDVIRNNDFGNRSVCTGTLTSASGTVSCDASSIVATDQFLFINVFVDGNQSSSYTINLNADTLSFGILNGAFYAFLLILLLITLFMEDKQVLVISLGIGWVIVLSLGLLRGALVGSASAGIWLLVSIGIFLWKLNQEEKI